VCEVEDNGIGLHRAMKSRSAFIHTYRSVGITNIRERLKLLNEKYHMQCSLNIQDKTDLPVKSESGTIAVLQLSV
ncbi:MAG: hypothetical protein ACTHK0_12545, partial [Ginsengibacter sp.]